MNHEIFVFSRGITLDYVALHEKTSIRVQYIANKHSEKVYKVIKSYLFDYRNTLQK